MVFSLLVVGTLGALYAFLFFETGKLQQRASALSADIINATSKQMLRGADKGIFEELAFHEAEVEAHLVPVDGVVPFLEGIESVGTLYGSDVAVVSVTDPAPDGRITLALSVVGSYDAVMRTVGYIEHGSQGSVTKSLTLDAIDSGLWSAALTLGVLTQKTP